MYVFARFCTKNFFWLHRILKVIRKFNYTKLVFCIIEGADRRTGRPHAAWAAETGPKRRRRKRAPEYIKHSCVIYSGAFVIVWLLFCEINVCDIMANASQQKFCSRLKTANKNSFLSQHFLHINHRVRLINHFPNF